MLCNIILGTPAERLAFAGDAKGRGNAKLKAGDLQEVITDYTMLCYAMMYYTIVYYNI